MVHFLCRNHFQSLTLGFKVALFDAQFLQHPCLRFISAKSESTDFTRDYLINTCGLPSETALTVAQKIRLKSADKPNAVLNLFQTHGFSKTQITAVISRYPTLLAVDAEKILKPKFEFNQSLGISGPKLAKLVTSDPSILGRGMEIQFAGLKYLKRFLDDRGVLIAYTRFTWILGQNLEKVMEPNIAILRNIGVPESNISKVLMYHGRHFVVKPERFNEIVHLVREMGLNPLSMMFLHVLRTLFSINKVTWKKKLAVYKELGFSEQETLKMFRSFPSCMLISEKKLRRAVDFFMNVLKLKSTVISVYPTLLALSMDKRIIPRCSVLGVLNSTGVLKKLAVKRALQISEKLFLKQYVTPYEENVPDVVKAYEGKIGFTGF